MKTLFARYIIGLFIIVFPAILAAQTITIPKNISLKESLRQIEKQTSYSFFYSDDDIPVNAPIKTNLSDDLKTILNWMAEQYKLHYEIKDKRIFIRALNQVSRRISGRVYDEGSNPLPGVNVYIEKTNVGTITNNQGYFALQLNDTTQPLKFSFIGYRDKVIPVPGDTSVTIFLEEAITSLNEVIIVAYGEESKDLLTGSVNSLHLNQFVLDGQENLNKSLQAISTGVYVQANAGTPGSSVNVKMRGVGSINAGTSPLYIVDGIPVISGDYSQIEFSGQLLDAMSDFSVYDVENITLLKDAASSSLYGSRASNGVILINTKMGDQKNAKVVFRTSAGVRNVENKLDLLNATQWMQVVNEEYAANGEQPPYCQAEINNPSVNTDWLNEVFQDALFQNYHLSFRGGTEKSNYYLSGTYRDEEGIVLGTDQKNYGVRINYKNHISDYFQLTIRSNQYKSRLNRVEGDQSLNGPLPNALSMPPIYPVYNDDGSYFNDGPYANPVSIAKEEKNLASTFRSLNVIALNLEMHKDLSFKSLFGYDFYRLREESYAPNTTRQGSKYNGYGIEANSDIGYFSNNTYLTWKKSHGFGYSKITTGFNVELQDEHYSYLRAQDFPGGDIQYLDAAATPVISRAFAEETRLQSVFARYGLSFSDKYIVSLNARLDGSSKFGKDNRYGFFPSISALWYISKEELFTNNVTFDYIKMRGSVGQVGNDRINNYLHFDLFQTGDNYNGEPGISPYQLPNSALKWETTTHYNWGLDIGFANRLNITADIYYKLTSDLLLEKPMPPSSGYNFVLSNIGKVENYGVELEMKYVQRFNDLLWHSTLVFSSYKNKVLELYKDQAIRNIGRARASIEVNEPISFFYGFNALGVNPQNGDIIYEDVNNDGNITDEDKKKTGSPHPKFYGGFEQAITYNNFTFSILLNYMYGNEIYNGTRYYKEAFSIQDNMTASVLDRWQNPGDNTHIPRFDSYNELLSSRYIEDGSYIKVKQIQVAYDFAKAIFKNSMQLEAFLSLENMLTFTNYSGMDPEVNYNGNNSIRMGTDFFTCPQPRTFLIGLCAEF